MEIIIDVPTKEGEFSGEDQFFFSVPISETEDIAFDYTFAGHRVMKQELVGEIEVDEEPTDVWESIKIKDGEVVDRYKVEWIDRREEGKAIINYNGVWNVWKTVWEKPLPEDIKEDLLEFSSEIYKHKDNLEELEGLFEELDNYMKGIVGRFVE